MRGLGRGRRWWLAAIALSGASAATAASSSDGDQKHRAELSASAPSAAPLFEQANHARDLGDPATAEQLYGRLFAEVPSFVHAERERCSALSRLDRPDEALPLCRDALAKDPSVASLHALARVLLQPAGGAEPTFVEMEEADALLKRALQLDPTNAVVVGEQCLLADQRESLEQLSRCTARLRELAPNDVWTVYWSWVYALDLGHFDQAERLMARAQKLGAPSEMLTHMQEGTNEARPWTAHAFRWLGRVLGGWAALCAALLLLSLVLSRITLRHLESWNHEPRKGSATLRAVYRATLLACSALYYAMLLIVQVSVFVAVGALISSMPAHDWPQTLLASLAVLAALAIGASTLKSVFFRPTEAAPGIRVDLANEPKLRVALAEVADQIGTRAVDTVYLSPDTKLAVFERKGDERCLVIGIALLEGMPLDAFKALLAHEYGHFSEGDTAGGAFSLAVLRSLEALILGSAPSRRPAFWNPAMWFATCFSLIFLYVNRGASFLQEVLADRRAAEAYGSVAFVTAVKQATVCNLDFDHPLDSEISRALAENFPLSRLWSPASNRGTGPAKLLEALNRVPSLHDSHPALCDRIRWVESLQAQPKVASESADAW
ncbi:MAG TPA: M48 family metallopeptidase, partial [Polyangiaceae bacterium]